MHHCVEGVRDLDQIDDVRRRNGAVVDREDARLWAGVPDRLGVWEGERGHGGDERIRKRHDIRETISALSIDAHMMHYSAYLKSESSVVVKYRYA